MANVFPTFLARNFRKNTKTNYIPVSAALDRDDIEKQQPVRQRKETERKPMSIENVIENTAAEDVVVNDTDENKDKEHTVINHAEVNVREDFLLSQIDEFREKAKQLQDLLASKESKARELQSLVSEREDKAQELEQILCERQEEADLIRLDFNKKVDELSDKVTNKMSDIEAAISNQVLEVKNVSIAQLEENRELGEERNRELFGKFDEFDAKIAKMDEMEKSVRAVRGYVKCLTWFSMLNFVLLVVIILYFLGVFNF